jgi:hypothetical protein
VNAMMAFVIQELSKTPVIYVNRALKANIHRREDCKLVMNVLPANIQSTKVVQVVNLAHVANMVPQKATSMKPVGVWIALQVVFLKSMDWTNWERVELVRVPGALVANTLRQLVKQKNRCAKTAALVVMVNLPPVRRISMSATNVRQDNFRKPLEHQTSTPVVNAPLDFHNHRRVKPIVYLA